jgi:hypothetical protein
MDRHVNVNDVALSLIGPGEQFGDHTIGDGHLAVVLSFGDSSVAIEGEIGELHQAVWSGFMVPLPASFVATLPLVEGDSE